MRKHYAGEFQTVLVSAVTGLVKPASPEADKPATRGNALAGAQLRGKGKPRLTR